MCYVKKSALKLSNFAYVDSQGNQQASIIETSQFLLKLKKIIQQCTAPDVKVLKKINKYKINLKMFNQSLTWEKSFHDLENSKISNIPLDMVIKY